MTAPRFLIILMLGIAGILPCAYLYGELSNLTSNDPYPVYTTEDPHTFLNRRRMQALGGHEVYGPFERTQISISGFRQSASVGNDFFKREVDLGDLLGRWNVLGLFYPERDGNTEIQERLFEALGITQAERLSCFNPSPVGHQVNLADPSVSDPNKEFGFFRVPMRYRKFGIRADIQIDLCEGFVFQIQTGVADLRQTASFVDLTCQATGLSCPVSDCNITPTDESGCSTQTVTTGDCANQNCCIDIFNCECKTLVINKIMDQFETIVTPTLHLIVREFHRTDPEDTRLILYWRHMYEINRLRPTWARFIITPFVEAGVVIPTGRRKCWNHLFDLPSGNDGHWGAGMNGGFTINWLETVEIGVEAGFTKYKDRVLKKYPVPTNQLQAGVFPQLAKLCKDPGINWSWAVTMSAYHFFERLSFWVQFVMVSHSEDCFKIICADTPVKNILIKKMHEESKWESVMCNMAFNYDISPNIELGALWQAPVKRRNAYKSTTVMGSIIVRF